MMNYFSSGLELGDAVDAASILVLSKLSGCASGSAIGSGFSSSTVMFFRLLGFSSSWLIFSMVSFMR